jgi:uncharacterized membrane protein
VNVGVEVGVSVGAVVAATVAVTVGVSVGVVLGLSVGTSEAVGLGARVGSGAAPPHAVNTKAVTSIAIHHKRMALSFEFDTPIKTPFLQIGNHPVP